MKQRMTVILLLFLLSAFYYADDILTKTGLSNELVKEKLLLHALEYQPEASGRSIALAWSYQSIPESMSKKIGLAYATTRSIVTGERAAIVTQFGNYVKNYFNSAQFKTDFYQKLGPAPALYDDSAYFQRQYDSAARLAQMELDANRKNFSTENRNAIQTKTNQQLDASSEAMRRVTEMIEKNPKLLEQSGLTKEEFMAKMSQAQGQVKTGRTETNKQIADQLSDEKNRAAITKAEQDYRDKLASARANLEANWHMVPDNARRYHEALLTYQQRKDYKTNIRRALQLFLDQTNNIDFAANTEQDGSIRRFTNPALEKKSHLWKACFRAGKAATEAGRAFAQQWLKEL